MAEEQYSDGEQLQIRFITKQPLYAVPDTPLSVPSTVNNQALSKLLKQLLKENYTDAIHVQFDFLISGELLRVPLNEHLRERTISTEAITNVEYLERTPAPEPQDSILHDDWVASVHVAGKWILTGLFDNTVVIHTTSGDKICVLREHTDRVRDVSWIDTNDPSKGFITAAHDLTSMLWSWDAEARKARPRVAFRGHERGIDSVGVSPNCERFASGGWDTNLKIWSTSFDYEVDDAANKKIKGIFTRIPLNTLKGHKESISAVMWLDPYNICTASMDHTIKFWDAELCGIKNEIVGQKAYLGATWSPLSRTVVACSADRHVRLYDPRSSEGTLCKSTFTSHTLWVAAVAWSEHNEHLFLSASYDRLVKMWDTRSPKAPLFDLTGHEDKVLCVNWSNPKFIVSGGTDNCLHIFKNKQGV